MAEDLASTLAKYNGILALVGGITVSVAAFKLIALIFDAIKTFFIPSLFNLDVKKLGEWAVVTGATDGIGKAFAKLLAKKGVNVVLISRTPERLAAVAEEIESASKVKTKVIAVDFTKGDEIFDTIKKGLEGLNIGVLINNVGSAYNYPEFYRNLEPQLIKDMIRMNCNSVAEMTYMVLPGMIQQKKGLIINIGSGSGLHPTPLISLYSATKAYVDVFSRSINAEYANDGITIQSLMPYFVTSKLSKMRRSNAFVPNPDNFVKYALETAGVKNQTTGYPTHGLQYAFINLFPENIRNSLTIYLMSNARRAALKKAAQKKD